MSGLLRFSLRSAHVLKHTEMKKLSLAFASLVGISTLLANGGAWQTGVPGTDSASAISRKNLQQPLT